MIIPRQKVNAQSAVGFKENDLAYSSSNSKLMCFQATTNEKLPTLEHLILDIKKMLKVTDCDRVSYNFIFFLPMKTAMDIPIADQREYLPPTH